MQYEFQSYYSQRRPGLSKKFSLIMTQVLITHISENTHRPYKRRLHLFRMVRSAFFQVGNGTGKTQKRYLELQVPFWWFSIFALLFKSFWSGNILRILQFIAHFQNFHLKYLLFVFVSVKRMKSLPLTIVLVSVTLFWTNWAEFHRLKRKYPCIMTFVLY